MASRRKLNRLFTLLLLLLALGVAPGFAQFSSGIEGTAHDTSGAVLAGARVTITDTRLGVSKETTTNDAGYFRIDSIAASTYTVEVHMSGFETWHQASLTLQVGEVRTLSPALKVGAASENVEVSAAETAVDLVTPTTGSVIADITVQQTPLPDQNIYGLTALTPGMTGSAVTAGDNYTNEYAININAAGLRQEQNGYMIDGAYTNTPSRGGSTSISPNPEIVQSMNVKTNNFDAQKGRNAGATVEVFTNSGSNNLHGTVDYYFRNDTLTWPTAFQGGKVPTFSRNEVSATMGGPALKNKLFWYGAIDVLRSSSAQAYTITAETQDFDNWVQTNLPNTVAASILKTAPPQSFPTSNIKTVAQVQAATPGYSKYNSVSIFPADLNAVGTSNISVTTPNNGYQWSFRVDSYLGKNDRIYVDAIRTSRNSEGIQARPATNIPYYDISDFANVDWTHTFSAKLLNEFSANEIRPQGANGTSPTEAIPYVNVTGLQGFGTWGAGNFIQTTVGWRDVMTATVKTHTLKFGYDGYNIRENDLQDSAFTRPTYNFDNILDFARDLATSESGTHVDLTTHGQAPYVRRYRELYTGLFIQDDWKLTPRFTLNAGVRYDSMGHLFAILSPKLTLLELAPGNRQQAIAGAVTVAAPNGRSNVLDHIVYGLTPRVGFAWDLFGNGRTALRGGAGMFADQPPYLHITDATSGNLPYFYSPSINVRQGNPTPAFQLCNPPTGYTEVCPVVDTSNVTFDAHGGILIDGVPQRSGLGGFDPNYKMTQVEAWTVSVQQQLSRDVIAEINYSGTEAHHLPIYQNANRFAGDLIVNDNNPHYLNPSFGAIEYGTSNGNSFGNVVSGVLTRRMSHGLSARGIYSFGKALDVYSTAQSLDSGEAPATSNIIQPDNFGAQRGRADFDIRQQFSADWTWTVPTHFDSLALKNILGGWQLAGIWMLQSGLPFTVYTSKAFEPVCDANPGGNCTDSTGAWIPGSVITANAGGDYNADGTNWDTPNVPSFGRHLSGKSKNDYLNGIFGPSATAAAQFPSPALGVEGNLGRNTYDQPGYDNVDLNLSKSFTTPWFFGERLKLEARGEILNLFNRANLTFVSSDMTSGTFGQATNSLPARTITFHVRASF